MLSRLIPALPVVVAALLYAPSLGFERTFDDDGHVRAPDEVETRSLADVWSRPYWSAEHGGGLYRPVTSSTFWIASRGGWPLGLRHGVNVLLYAVVTFLVVGLARRLGMPVWAAGLAGLLFAVHATHVEVVAGLVGRSELLAAGFMLAALGLTAGASAGGPSRWAWVWAVPLAFLAAGSKESAWLLPAYAAILLGARGCLRTGGLPVVGGLSLGLAAHLILRRQVLGGWLNDPGLTVSPFDNPLLALDCGERILAAIRVTGVYASHLILPGTLSPDYTGSQIALDGGPADPRLWLGVLLLIVPAVSAFLMWRRSAHPRSVVVAAGLWFALAVWATSNVLVPLGTIFGDRLLFWPTACLSLWVVGGVVALVPGARREVRAVWPRGGAAIAAAVLVILGGIHAVRAAAYLPHWRNDRTLFAYAVDAAPRVPRVWFNHGRELQDQGRHGDALVCYRRATGLDSTYAEAFSEQAAALMLMERWEEATTPLDRAAALLPGDPVIRINQGVAHMQVDHWDAAAAAFEGVLAAHPRRPEALYNLALVELERGRPQTAVDLWRRYLEVEPGDASAYNQIAWTLATRLDRAEAAEPEARRAVSLDAENAAYRDTLAECLLRQGKREEAVAALETAARLDPDGGYRERLEAVREP